jgi:hypothetical protein
VEERNVYRGVCKNFLTPYIVCRQAKCVHMQVTQGKIMYRVYMFCRREN